MPLHECREVEPLPDGTILCPQCERLAGYDTPDKSQWYCRHCKIDLAVKRSEFSVALKNSGIEAKAANMDKRQMLAMYLINDMQATANRAKALELLQQLPD